MDRISFCSRNACVFRPVYIDDSSNQITSSNPSSASSMYCLAQVSCFSLFTFLINWQYALPRKVQPNSLGQCKIVEIEISIPFFSQELMNLVGSSFVILQHLCLYNQLNLVRNFSRPSRSFPSSYAASTMVNS